MPSSWGAQAKPPCARVSVLKSAAGIDVTKMYPEKDEYIPAMDEWTLETHLKAAEAVASRRAQHAGVPCPARHCSADIYQRGVYPTMLAKLQSGQSIPQVIAWAKDEVEGSVR